jgi:hypothetical protein
MSTPLIKQIENDLLKTVKEGLKDIDLNNAMSGAMAINLVSESVQAYRDNLLAKKETLHLNDKEIDELLETASENVFEKLFEQ